MNYLDFCMESSSTRQHKSWEPSKGPVVLLVEEEEKDKKRSHNNRNLQRAS